MKTILGVSILAATLAVAAIADTATNPPAKTATKAPAPDAARPMAKAFRHSRMAVVAERLGLTDAQQAKLKDLRGQTAAAIQGVKANNTLTEDQKQAQIKALREGARGQMRGVLSDDQRAKLAEIRGHPRMLNALAARRMRVAMVARRLDLTSEQKASIKEIREKTQAAVKPIRADSSLTPEAKKARVRELVQASRTEIQGLLSPEQQTRLQRMRRRLLAPLGPLG